MSWAVHVASTGERRGEVHSRLWWGNLRDRDHLKDPGVDVRIILRWTFRKWDGKGHGLDQCSSRIGTGGGHL